MESVGGGRSELWHASVGAWSNRVYEVCVAAEDKQNDPRERKLVTRLVLLMELVRCEPPGLVGGGEFWIVQGCPVEMGFSMRCPTSLGHTGNE